MLVDQSCLTLCQPLDCSPSGSSVHVILQARILEWVAGVFPTQESNQGLLYRRQILYQLNYVGSPWWNVAAAAKSLQSCPTLCDPVDGSPPGFPVPGILQARTLEWGAIAFSEREYSGREIWEAFRLRKCLSWQELFTDWIWSVWLQSEVFEIWFRQLIE